MRPSPFLVLPLCILMSACAEDPPAGTSQETTAPLSPLQIAQGLSRAFGDAAGRVSNAVVHIAVVARGADNTTIGDDKLPGLFDLPSPEATPKEGTPDFESRGFGTGVIVDHEGHIVTNGHVVVGARQVAVKFLNGKVRHATVKKIDTETDLAILDVPDIESPPAKLGDSDACSLGEWVIAIGNPFGFSHTITAGIVSARGRSMPGAPKLHDLIQTDTPINPGNSGGPLINLNGEVIGINTAIISRTGGSVGIGFAIPSNRVKAMLRELQDPEGQ